VQPAFLFSFFFDPIANVIKGSTSAFQGNNCRRSILVYFDLFRPHCFTTVVTVTRLVSFRQLADELEMQPKNTKLNLFMQGFSLQVKCSGNTRSVTHQDLQTGKKFTLTRTYSYYDSETFTSPGCIIRNPDAGHGVL